MAIGPPEQGRRNLLCTHSRGSLAVLNSELQEASPDIVVPRRFLQSIVAADLAGDGQWRYCAVASRKLGENLVLGFNLKGEDLWNYTLPQGFQSQPIEPIIAGKLTAGAAGQWLLPGPDGSIHILDADGRLVDQFNYGAALCGLATVEIDGKPALIVATPGSIEALGVE